MGWVMITLDELPATMPREGAVRIELVEGVPLFRASGEVQKRIEALLERSAQAVLTSGEAQELERYAEIDDYLSLVNRVVRNLLLEEGQGEA